MTVHKEQEEIIEDSNLVWTQFQHLVGNGQNTFLPNLIVHCADKQMKIDVVFSPLAPQKQFGRILCSCERPANKQETGILNKNGPNNF